MSRKSIRINPKMRGVFTKKAKRKGMSVQKYAKHIVKKYKGKKKTKRQLKLFRQALFAKTAKKWKKKKTRKKKGGVYTQDQIDAMSRKIDKITRQKNMKVNILINGITNKTLSENEMFELANEVADMTESLKIHYRGLVNMQQQGKPPTFITPNPRKRRKVNPP